MKIAHLADIHYCPKHLKWVDRAMVAAVDRTIEEQCDVAVIAGDSFDHGMGLHEPAVTAFIRQVVCLAERMPVLVLQGTYSHDRPGSLDVLKEIPTDNHVLVADEPGIYVMNADKGWDSWSGSDNSPFLSGDRAMFCCLPSLNKAAPEIMENGAQHYVGNIVQRFAIATAEAQAAGIPSVMVTHGTINGCQTESKFALVSPDHEFSEDLLFRSGADAIMMGHVHAHQEWRDGDQIIAYPGSLARLVHGDHSDKGWLLWDIEPRSATYQFIPSPTRQLLEIEFNGPPVMEELAGLAAQATGDDAVRIRWMVDQEYASDVDKAAIRAMFAHCDTVKLEGTVLPIQSVRAAGISRAATLVDKLGYWCKTTGDEARLADLKERLAMLQGHDAEEVVDLLLREKVGPLQRQVG